MINTRVTQGTDFDVLGLGAVAIDDFLYVDAYPPPDAKAPVVFRQRQLGGLTATALVTVARLGARSAYAGVLGNDELSEAAVAGLAHEGIDLTYLVRQANARPIHSTIVVAQQQPTRNIFFDSNDVVGADRELPAAAVIQRSRVLLVDNFGVSGMVRAARIAHDAGIPVVGDFEADDAPHFAELLSLTDHLILSASFARNLTRASNVNDVIERLWEPNRETVIVTCGVDGIWYLSNAETKSIQYQPAFSVKTVDSTGCGDVFHGAYAFALARGLAITSRVRMAAAAAAIKATQPGGQAGIPDWASLAAFLSQHGEPNETLRAAG
jgi:sugar/nucleoside kinase (ribokinase family)